MSKYDSIQTAAELVSEVRFHGLSTAQEDICRAQDIFGNSSIEDLVALANDIGRNNDQGEPDPKGSWSSSRQPTQSTFYMIASCIWNWEEVTRFWNQHTNPERIELVEAKRQIKKLTAENEQLKKRRDELLASEEEVGQKLWEMGQEKGKVEIELEVAKKEVVELKAKLYDLMVGQERRA